MRILMVSSEAVPFSKSGGLADVATSLSIALSQLGNDVRLVIPGYALTDDTLFTTLPVKVELAFGDMKETVGFKQLDYQGTIVYLVDHKWYSERKGIYGDTSFTPYADNLIRYTLLSKASLALCKALQWTPDILHCHDWTAGFTPALLAEDGDGTFNTTKSVFTIHNLAYQGEFPRMDMFAHRYGDHSIDVLRSRSPQKGQHVEGRFGEGRCHHHRESNLCERDTGGGTGM